MKFTKGEQKHLITQKNFSTGFLMRKLSLTPAHIPGIDSERASNTDLPRTAEHRLRVR